MSSFTAKSKFNKYATISGNTPDVYAVALQIDCRNSIGSSLILWNNGGGSLDVQIATKMDAAASIEYSELDTTTIVPTGTVRYFEKDTLGTILVYIRASVAGIPANYTIEYIVER